MRNEDRVGEGRAEHIAENSQLTALNVPDSSGLVRARRHDAIAGAGAHFARSQTKTVLSPTAARSEPRGLNWTSATDRACVSRKRSGRQRCPESCHTRTFPSLPAAASSSSPGLNAPALSGVNERARNVTSLRGLHPRRARHLRAS